MQNLPLREISPAIIIFEAIHLPKKRLIAAFQFLHGHDYYTTRYGQNGLAFKRDILPRIPVKARGDWTQRMIAAGAGGAGGGAGGGGGQ